MSEKEKLTKSRNVALTISIGLIALSFVLANFAQPAIGMLEFWYGGLSVASGVGGIICFVASICVEFARHDEVS